MDIGYFLKLMTEKNASDMFLTTGAPVYIKVEGKLYPLGNTGLPAGMVKKIAYSLMDEGQVPAFERDLEYNMAIAVKDIIDVAGLVTGCGSLTTKGKAPAERDAPVVDRLRVTGAQYTLPSRLREALPSLAPGQAMELVNDHDPRPLYYQFNDRMPGQFAWDYLEAGPDTWRVAITRTATAHEAGSCCGSSGRRSGSATACSGRAHRRS